MQYDNLHNITGKKQYIEQKGIQFDGVLKAGYDLAYNYANNPFQISTLKDDNYRTEGTDAKDVTKKEHKYEYDANGNLVYINTERPKKDGTQTPKSTERKLLWDEENRLEAIDDNGYVSNYWYDAAGERTVKTSGESQQVYVNSVFSGGDTQTANFTAYVNPYLVVSKGGQYTKHIYIGSQRIVSKLGDLDSYGSDPRRIEYAGANVDGAKVDYATKYEALQQSIKDRYTAFEVPYYGKDNDDYVNGQGFCCEDSKTLKSFSATGNDNPELFQYYYHSDHLGSSSLITNLDGEIVQHIEYVPFGEVFIEERNSTWNTPYLFNAKELDEETGLYYYGARYYDPRVSLWLSTDPLQEKYPNVSTYAYCAQNPVKFIDLDGRKWTPSAKKWADKLDEDMTNQLKGKQKDVDKANNEIKEKGWSQKREDNLNKKTATLNDLSNKFKAIRNELAELAASDQVYNVVEDASLNAARLLGVANGEAGGRTLYNLSTGAVDIGIPTLDDQLVFFSHEAKHAYQFEMGRISIKFCDSTNGELSAKGSVGTDLLFYDWTDEQEAYARGALFGSHRLPGRPAATPISATDYTNHSYNNILSGSNIPQIQQISKMYQMAFRIPVNGVKTTFAKQK